MSWMQSQYVAHGRHCHAVDGKKHRRRVYAGRLRLRAVPDRGADALTGFVKDNVALGSVLRTDGWTGYPGLTETGYRHEALTLGGDPDKAGGALAHDPSCFQQSENLDQGDASQPYRAQTPASLP